MSGGDYQGAQMSREMKRSEFIERLETLYEAGEVKRMHTLTTLRPHTIAEHVYGSLLIAVELCAMNDVGVVGTLAVLTTLLYHDAPELSTGDIPAPVKRRSHEISDALEELEAEFEQRVGYTNPKLSEHEAAIVKACDTLDLMWKCVMERRLGNNHIRIGTVFNNVRNYIQAQVHVRGVESVSTHLFTEWVGEQR